MPSLEEVRQRTRATLIAMGVQESDLDLSYITEDLLAEPAQEKESADAQSEPATEAMPNYFGNRLVHESGPVWTYTNSNPSTGSDLPGHKCGSGYRWRASFSSYNTGSGWGCPGNNPPGGFQAWA